jgi:hypothetical protein
MLEFNQANNKQLKASEFKRLSSEYPIVFVQPLSVAESSVYHLMLVTQNGYRVYIQFETEDALEPQPEEYN